MKPTATAKKPRAAAGTAKIATASNFTRVLKETDQLFRKGDFAAVDARLSALQSQGCKAPEFFFLLGVSQMVKRNWPEAISRLQQAILANPSYAEAHYQLGMSHFAQGAKEEALLCARRAAYFKPNNADFLFFLASMLADHGKFSEAMQPIITVMTQRAAQPSVCALYTRITGNLAPTPEEKILRGPLEMIFVGKTPLPSSYRRPLIRQILLKEEMAELMALVVEHRHDKVYEKVSQAAFLEKLQDPLLFTLMQKTQVTNPGLEMALTTLRCALLLQPALRKTPAARPWLIALLANGFNAEYAGFVSPEETTALDTLAAALSPAASLEDLAIYGAYRPLATLPFADSLADWAKSHAEAAPFIERQVTAVLAERQRAEKIPSLGTVEDATSQRVQAQYEENPYPRWNEVILPPATTWDKYLRGQLPHSPAPKLPGVLTPQVLIAGCGTGVQAVTVASCLNRCEILAMDLSRASLAYATQRAERMKFKHLSFMQGDLLQLEKLGRKFHHIECTGVLHHLADPMQGWRKLVDALEPGGVMQLGLYSQTARRHITDMRGYIAAKGLRGTPAEIRQTRRDLMDGAITEASASIMAMQDFYTLSECRDLLFHTEEHLFTLAQIKQALATLGLTFLGFSLIDGPTWETYRHANPADKQGTNLDGWHAFEQKHPGTFGAMYRFWVQKA